MKNSNRINRSSESRGFLGVVERFTRRSPLTKRAGKSVLAWRASAHIFLSAVALWISSGFFSVPVAHAQGDQCHCISIDTSSTILCDTCWILGINYINGTWDTTWVCDTCYSFTLTNNCLQGISAFSVFDSNSSGGLKGLHHGCAIIQNAAEDTDWEMSNPGDSCVMFTDRDAPSGCWEPGQTMIVSICNPLHRGDKIVLEWWACNLPPPHNEPTCPYNNTSETLTVP